MANKDSAHADILADITYDNQAGYETRERAVEDFRFHSVPGGQWESFWERKYDNRAKMEIDMVSESHNRFMGGYTENQIEPDFAPDDESTSSDDAELLKGLYRRDRRRGGGELAKTNAVAECSICGFGAYELATEYIDEAAEDGRQRIIFNPITNAHQSVIYDAGAQRIDKRDARRVTLVREMDVNALRDEYGDDVDEFSSVLKGSIVRHRSRNMKKSVFLGEHYVRHRKIAVASVWMNPLTGQVEVFYDDDIDLIKDDLANQGYIHQRDKKVTRHYVEKSIVHGGGFVSEPKRIVGEFLPIIPVYAFRTNVDGQEFYYGNIRKRKDPQRLLNMQISTLAETAASSGKRLPVLDPKEIEGLKPLWSGDVSKKPYLLKHKAIKDKDTGQVLNFPPEYLDPPVVDPSTAALLEFTSSILNQKNGGSIEEFAQGEHSGKAIRALMRRYNMDTKPILDNIATSTVLEGDIYHSMASEVYTNHKLVKTVAQDGSEQMVRLNQLVADADSGELVVTNDISKMKFEVVVDVGIAYDTVREETLETLRSMRREIAEVDPDSAYIPVIDAMIFENLGGVNMDLMKEFNRKQMLASGLKKPETPEDQQLLDGMQQPSAQDELAAAATRQADAEARNLDASAIDKQASAEKKQAETMKILADIDQNQQRIDLDRISKTLPSIKEMRQAISQPRVLQ